MYADKLSELFDNKKKTKKEVTEDDDGLLNNTYYYYNKMKWSVGIVLEMTTACILFYN